MDQCTKCVAEIKKFMKNVNRSVVLPKLHHDDKHMKIYNGYHFRISRSGKLFGCYQDLIECPTGLNVPDSELEKVGITRHIETLGGQCDEKQYWKLIDNETSDTKQCRKCVAQINTFMGDYEEAVVWQTGYNLFADCDWVLSTISPVPHMRLYNGINELRDTGYGDGIDLTDCPVGMCLDNDYFEEKGLQYTTKNPYIRYVDYFKPHERCYINPGNQEYLKVRRKSPHEDLFNPFL